MKNSVFLILMACGFTLGAAEPEAPVVAQPEAASPTAEAGSADMVTPEATPTERPTPDTSGAALLSRIEALEKEQKGEVKIEGYGQIRYDNQRYKAAGYIAPELGPRPLTTAFNSQGGVYIKRAEIKFSGKLLEGLDWAFSYGFEEGKLKDAGVIWKKLPMLLDGYTFDLQLGQFRQKFGIEPQTGTPKLPFIERALMYGGAHPLGGGSLKAVGERALGVHALHSKDYGRLGYEMGFSYVGDTADQVKGTNTLIGAFPGEPTNGRAAYTGRFGLVVKKLYGVSGPLKAGVSGLHDDISVITNAASADKISETAGVDFYFEPLKDWIWLQGEWLSTQELTLTPGLRYNAFYAEGGVRVPSVPAFWGAGFELAGRYERATWRTPGFPQYVTASTLQARFNYGKASHTAFSMTYYAPEDHYEEATDLAFYSIQQQFAF